MTFFPNFKAGPWINPTQPLGNNMKKIFNDPETVSLSDPNNDPITNRVSICTFCIMVIAIQLLLAETVVSSSEYSTDGKQLEG